MFCKKGLVVIIMGVDFILSFVVCIFVLLDFVKKFVFFLYIILLGVRISFL